MKIKFLICGISLWAIDAGVYNPPRPIPCGMYGGGVQNKRGKYHLDKCKRTGVVCRY